MSSYKIEKTLGNTDWFVNDRFGMFIHFGLYSMPSRHEWVKCKEQLSEEHYDKYFKYFNPDMFDAREWAKTAKEAGMKYAILTTKHHEGFCLFDTKYTDYKITNTPFGRDLVKEYVETFRAEGLKVGFYYSLIDWHHPDFPIDILHPRHADPKAEQMDKGRDMHKYAKYMRDQLTELLTNYGKIDILWTDYSYSIEKGSVNYREWMQYEGVKGKNEWEAEELIKTVRSLQPDIIMNNRTEIEQDLVTPEQSQLDYWVQNEKGEYKVWEACHTFSGSWGYYRDEMCWKTPEILINALVDTVSLGGNLIMNVGPNSRGVFDERAKNALKAYGDWMKVNSRAIYGCTMAEPEFTAPEGCKLTQSTDGKRLYIHIQKYPLEEITFYGLPIEKVDYAQFLTDGSEVQYEEIKAKSFGGIFIENKDKGVAFKTPVTVADKLVPVIEIFLK